MVLNQSMISKGIIISCLQFIKVLSFFLFYKVLFAKGNSELVSNFVLIETYVNLLASICSFGIIDTTVRLFKDFKGNITLFLKNHLIIFLITYFVCSIVLFLSINELENSIFIYPLIFLNVILNFFVGYFLLIERPIFSNLISSSFSPLILLFSYIVLTFSLDSSLIFVFWGISKIILILFSFIFFISSAGKIAFTKENFSTSRFFTISSSLTLSNFTFIFQGSFLIIIINSLGNSDDLISVKLGQQLSLFALIISNAFTDQIKPKISKLYLARKYNEINDIFYEHRLNSFVISSLYVLITSIFLTNILDFLSQDANLDVYIILIYLFGTLASIFMGAIPVLYNFTSYEFDFLKIRLLLIFIICSCAYPIILMFGIKTFLYFQILITITAQFIMRRNIFNKLKNEN